MSSGGWEYHFLTLSPNEWGDFDPATGLSASGGPKDFMERVRTEVGALGRDGWEMATSQYLSWSELWVMVFKRRLVQDRPSVPRLD